MSPAAKSGRSAKRGPRKAKSKEPGLELLFEIGCEEIPAGMLPRAEEELKSSFEKLLATESLAEGVAAEVFSAPRRLVLRATGLIGRQADVVSEVTGPPKSVAYDSVGAPTRAAVSFAEKQGIALHDVYFVQTAKGEYLAARQTKRGRSTDTILSEILPRIIHDLSWPRSMTWTGVDGARFIRPIRWIVALLGGKVLRFSYGGVTAGDITRGHRFIGSSSIRVKHYADYEKKLRANGAIVRPSERAEMIQRELGGLTRKGGYRVHEDDGLMKAVTYLNEFPSVIQGSFDPSFLDLPDEILITVMRGHQKYFAVEKRGGELAPHFLAVINLGKDPKGLIRSGHEKVLRARFSDARFFWKADQKCRLADYLPKLERITYESRLGSYRDKVERTRAIARWLAEQWFNLGIVQAHVAETDRAAELAKCDLATEMVREFTELQGVVGGLYAKAQGESEEVAEAVYDHYLPAGLDDPTPRNLTGSAVAIADKLDSVVGCFAVGVIPSGSSDPFGLRRAALGIVKIILEKKLPVSLSLAVASAVKFLAAHPPKKTVTPQQEAQILDFILDRARFVFREKEGFDYGEVNAVFRAGAEDLVDARKRLEALKSIRRSKNFEPLSVSFKRIRKILEKAGVKIEEVHNVDAERFENEAERVLFKAMRAASPRVGEHKRAGHYREALEIIAGLRPDVDRFFEQVMVMAEDPGVRNNRIALLAELLRAFTTIADFSEMAGDSRA